MSSTTPPSDDPGTEPAKPVAPTSKRLTGIQWLEIIGMAKEGVSPRKIAGTFGISVTSVYKGLAKRKIKVGVYTRPAEELEASKRAKDNIGHAIKAKDRSHGHTVIVEGLMMKLVADAQKHGDQISKYRDDIDAYLQVLKGLESARKTKWIALGLDREQKDAGDQLPELPIRPMTLDEVQEIRDAQEFQDLIDGDDPDADDDDVVDEEPVARGADYDDDED